MNHSVDISADNLRLDDLGTNLSRTTALVGAIALAAAIILAFLSESSRPHFFYTYVVSFTFYVSLSLGALFFVLIQHMTKAGWSVVVRRLAEGIACNFVLLALLAVPLLFGLETVFHWADPEHVAHDKLLKGKAPYLNVPFFLVRLAVYFLVWIVLSRFFFATSVRQDATGEPNLTRRMQTVSFPGMLLFALTLTFFSFDFLMSLDAHWFSTIFGVYYFSGSVVGFCGLLPLAIYALQQRGRLERAVTREHYHDVGKLLFAFVVFWAYIAFSQYMLIWYANIPEETGWFLVRQESNQWRNVSIFLLVGHFFLPFVLLMSRHPKRRLHILVIGAVWMLLMHYVDLYWIVMPNFNEESVPFNHIDLLCFIGMGGLFVGSALRRLQDCSLIPVGDPRLEESVTFENV